MGERGSDRSLRTAYAPEPGVPLAWAEAFGTRFTIFVDTEEEFDWAGPFRRDGHGTGHMAAMPAAHARFAAHGVPLTWLIDYPVAACERSVEILRDLMTDGRSAIGTQLHPWVNPPFDEALSTYNSFAGNLPIELERAKLLALTARIETAFATPPRIYRAGRYGLGPSTLRLLRTLGYLADSSMRAGYDYSPEGGPDFRGIGNHAFHAEGMVELPLTTVFAGAARRGGARLHAVLGRFPRGRGVAARLRLLNRVALSPEDMPIGEALEAVHIAVGDGVRLLNFSFHSPSIEPGHTPYVRDAADLKTFFGWWETMLAELDRLGVAPASLDEILDAACGASAASAKAAAAGGL